MSSRKAEKEQARARREASEVERQQHQGQRRRLKLLGGALAVAAIAVVAVVIATSEGGSSGGPVEGASAVTKQFEGIPQSGIYLGSAKAPVTMVEFADLKCPACQQYSNDVLPKLIDRYVRTGKVRMAFRSQTFVGEQTAPGDSLKAAQMAGAVSLQNRLWQFVDLFYRNQQDESTSYATDGFLRKLGNAVAGLDVERALTARENPAVTAQIEQAAKLFETNGFSGTPSFLVGRTGEQLNPVMVTSIELSTFTDAIDPLLP